MKVTFNKKSINDWIHMFLIIVLAIIFYKFIENMDHVYFSFSTKLEALKKILTPFIIAIFIAYILNPIVQWFEENIFGKIFKNTRVKKYNRIISTIVVFILLLGVMGLTLIKVMPRIVISISDLMSRLPQFIYDNETKMVTLVKQLYTNDMYNIGSIFEKNINEIFSKAGDLAQIGLNNTLESIISFTSGLLNLIIGLIVSFYILMDKKYLMLNIKKLLRAILEENQIIKFKNFCKEANDIFIKFIIGKSVDSFIIGCICFVGLSLVKSPYPLLISIIVGVTNMIPYFGPFIGEIVGFIIVSFHTPSKALLVLLFLFILQQFDGFILSPKILGDRVGIRPLWVIFAVILGGGLFGILGMFLGVPAIAIVAILLSRFIAKKLQEKENKGENI